jgi:hypothetical protein
MKLDSPPETTSVWHGLTPSSQTALTGFPSNPLTTAGHDQENLDVAVQVSQRSAGDGGAGAQTAQTARRCPGGGAKLAYERSFVRL